MKRIILWLTGGLLATAATAQQMPHYTQYILNQYVLNPAITGIENYADVKLSHRHQWAGIADAPVTTYFTIHAPLRKKDYRVTPTSFAVPGENPWGKRYWESYTAPEPHHGVGMQVINDRTGPINRFSAYATYAYHMGLGPATSLSAGFGAGVTHIGLDASSLEFGTTQVDPAVYSSGQINRLKPDLTAGLYLYSRNFFTGLSAQQVIPQKVNFSEGTVTKEDGRIVPHLFLLAGYRIGLGEELNLIPSLMVKYIQPLPTQLEVNAKLQYLDKLWIGSTWRYKDGFAGMMGMNVSNTFNLGYAYDYTTSGLNHYSKGTHELMLGFLIGNDFNDYAPRSVW